MNRRAWLHFVGKSYYSREEFIFESKAHGVSRAVAPNILKKMQMGDAVFLAQGDAKSSVIFGMFIIDRLIGLSEDLIQEMTRQNLIEVQTVDPYKVERGCGSYVVGAECKIKDRNAIFDLIRNTKDADIGRVMVGGEFFTLPLCEEVETEIPFRMGFRRFDKTLFDEEVAKKKRARPNAKKISVRGHFYQFDDEEGLAEIPYPVEFPMLLKISNYQLN